jgi:hypothetical protein
MGHILHDWDLDQKKILLAKAYAALPSGGALIVYEALIDDERKQNAFGLLMSLNMLIETTGGFDYTGADCTGTESYYTAYFGYDGVRRLTFNAETPRDLHRALIERFENPALRHRTWQICMDGSQKLPQRLLGSIRDRLAAGAPVDRLVMGVAGWMRYVTGIDEAGKPIDVRDPLSGRLRQIADQAGMTADRLAPALLDVREIFGDLAADARFRDAVTKALAAIIAKGARVAVAEVGQ